MEIMRDNYNSMLKACVIVGDTIICCVLFYLFYIFSLSPGEPDTRSMHFLHIIITIALCYAICDFMGGTVIHKRKVHSYQIVNHAFRCVFLFTILGSMLLEVGHYINIFSSVYLLFITVLFICVSGFRMFIRMLVKASRTSGKNLRYVVFVGSSDINRRLLHELLDDPAWGYRTYGYFDYSRNALMPRSCPYLGTPDDAPVYLAAHPDIHYLYCSLPSENNDQISRLINYCENHLVHFYIVPYLHKFIHHRIYFNLQGDVPYISLRPDPLSRPENRMLKRAFDIVFSLAFLCTVFPFVYLIVAAITKITMPGPVFFRQKRNGLNDREFYVYKFRSMKVNDQADTLQATRDDPRKTKWGNFMRKTNIDELPQFINVLLGDMSIVGPRPHMLKHTEEYSKLIDKYMMRHFVRPGITGWSQVNGFRGETKELKDMEQRIHGDIWYIEHWSFWLDISIIYMTVANVFKGEKNAY